MIAKLENECEKALTGAIDEIEHLRVSNRPQVYALMIQRFQRLNTEFVELMLKICKYNELGAQQKKAIDQIVEKFLQRYRQKYFEDTF